MTEVRLVLLEALLLLLPLLLLLVFQDYVSDRQAVEIVHVGRHQNEWG